MLTVRLFGTGRRWTPLPEALALLWQAAAWREELRQLLLLLAERADHRLYPLPWALPVPLRVHGRYSRAEIEAAYCCAEACGYGNLPDDAPWIHREGVLWHGPSQTDLLFVTVNKSEALFSPTSRTNDDAISPWELHWESQSLTWAASPTGQRTIHHREQTGRRHQAVPLPRFCRRREPRRRAADGDSLAPAAADPCGLLSGAGGGGVRRAKLDQPSCWRP